VYSNPGRRRGGSHHPDARGAAEGEGARAADPAEAFGAERRVAEAAGEAQGRDA
jgi:hypothetical protein